VIVKEMTKDEKSILVRQYSVLSGPDQQDYFELLIKLYPAGKMSACIRRWTSGTKVLMRGPFGDFTHDPRRQGRLLLVCQGTGLVPFVSTIQSILDQQQDETRIRLVYSVSTTDEILVKEDLFQFCDFWNFSLKIFSGHPIGKFRLIGPNRDIVHAKLDARHLASEVDENTFAILCGSKDFMNDMAAHLESLHLAEDRMQKL